jgi:uncharacterized MnhB-related membrane protein
MQMVLHFALLLGALVCAVFAIRSKPLTAALWLAGLSAIIAILLYLHGATEVAVIELSVGAGLITVLLAFAVSMAEDETMPASLIPHPLAWFLVILAGGLLLWLILPQVPFISERAAADAPFVVEVWENRLLDLIVQITIILAGVMGILSLLGETTITEPSEQPAPERTR